MVLDEIDRAGLAGDDDRLKRSQAGRGNLVEDRAIEQRNREQVRNAVAGDELTERDGVNGRGIGRDDEHPA